MAITLHFPLVSVHGKEPLPILDASEVKEVKKELATIRDKVTALLDALDITPKSVPTARATASMKSAVAEQKGDLVLTHTHTHTHTHAHTHAHTHTHVVLTHTHM